jgi:hypothetical protein
LSGLYERGLLYFFQCTLRLISWRIGLCSMISSFNLNFMSWIWLVAS